MLSRRIIPCLDVRDGRVVKGVRFRDHVDMGDIVELALRYRDAGADELVFYDIAASPEGRSVDRGWVERVARLIDIPFCVAGGIRGVEDARAVLRAGADKISINTPALERPALIAELADAMQLQREVRHGDARQRVVDVVGDIAIHIADEGQRQVQLLAALPARPGHPALQKHQRLGHALRDGKADKQSHGALRARGLMRPSREGGPGRPAPCRRNIIPPPAAPRPGLRHRHARPKAARPQRRPRRRPAPPAVRQAARAGTVPRSPEGRGFCP